MSDDPDKTDSRRDGRPQDADRFGQLPELKLSGLKSATAKKPGTSENPEENWNTPRSSEPDLPVRVWLLAGIAFVCGGVLVASLYEKDAEKDTETDATTGPETSAQEHRQLFTKHANITELRSATTRSIRGFMEARNDLERCEFVVGGPDLEEKMREYHARPDSPSPRGFGALLDLQPVAMDGVPMEIAMVSESDQQTGWSFIILPLWAGVAIDWEASVGYGEMAWPRFLKERPTDPTQMRVYLKRLPDDGLTPASDLEEDLYEISSRAFPDRIVCGVPRGSAVGDQLSRIVPPGGSQPVNLLLKWTPNSSSEPALKITEVLHNFWIDFERWKAFLNTVE